MLLWLVCLLWLYFADGCRMAVACTAMYRMTSLQALVLKLVHVCQALLALNLLFFCCLCTALFTPSSPALASNIMAFLVPTVSLTATLHILLSPLLADKCAWVCLQS